MGKRPIHPGAVGPASPDCAGVGPGQAEQSHRRGTRDQSSAGKQVADSIIGDCIEPETSGKTYTLPSTAGTQCRQHLERDIRHGQVRPVFRGLVLLELPHNFGQARSIVLAADQVSVQGLPRSIRRLGVNHLKLGAPAVAVAYSPDGKMLVTASKDKVIAWDAETRKTLWRKDSLPVKVGQLEFSPDGKLLAAIIARQSSTSGSTLAKRGLSSSLGPTDVPGPCG